MFKKWGFNFFISFIISEDADFPCAALSRKLYAYTVKQQCQVTYNQVCNSKLLSQAAALGTCSESNRNMKLLFSCWFSGNFSFFVAIHVILRKGSVISNCFPSYPYLPELFFIGN